MRLFLAVALIMFSVGAYAAPAEFSKVASGKPELIQSGPQKMWCPICGMNLKMFYKTSHALKLAGDQNKQYCSIRCMLEDYEGLQSIVKEILVVDAKTEKLVSALTAHYVVGSTAPGTMTMTSKYAFASEADAKEFQAAMGGQLMTYEQASKSALETMKKDVAMTDMKRGKMMYPKGKKIFETACDKTIDPFTYNLINEMKADIKAKNRCGQVNEKELQAVALYLWDIVRKEAKAENFVTVKEGEKCPVCGMFVHKYPKWAAKIDYTSAGAESHAVFDGVKDMMKFYFNPAKWGKYEGIQMSKIAVTDYYSNAAIDAKAAFYVVGADVYGPMGKELIPFSSEEYAKTFSADHAGEKILKFSEITEELVYALDK